MAVDTPNDAPGSRVAVVVIGRNEGERLVRCLASLPDPAHAVYVDSGSTDGSAAAARRAGADVVELDMTLPFTAARARNAGLHRLSSRSPAPDFVQMVDGDCTLAPGWIDAARAAHAAEPELGAVFGRRRERDPAASLYNAMCDEEWDVPVGLVRACGGDALFRTAALVGAGGYDPSLIAGEEPDLCWRMAADGWRVRRIAGEMTLHDAAITRFAQAHRRAMRAGHAFAELVWRHGARADPAWRRAVASTLLWGAALPLLAALGVLIGLVRPAALLLTAGIAALFVVQWARIAWRKRGDGHDASYAGKAAAILLATKLSQMAGVARFHLDRVRHRRARLIEYKTAP